MPRIAKQAPQKAAPIRQGLDAVLRAIKQEGELWEDVGEQTRLTYLRNYEQLKAGWNMGTARKQTRYAMRASGVYVMRKELRKIGKAAEKILRDVSKGVIGQAEGNKAYGEKIAEGAKLLDALKKFKDQPWNEVDDPKAHYLEANHKKRPATDAQLVAFYEAAQRSSFRDAFLVCEFAGVRPEEVSKGVRVELLRVYGTVTLRFHIESAKCDGKKKGLELRTVDVKHPKGASREVRERFKELATIVAENSKSTGWVCKVEPTQGKDGKKPMSGARRLTNAFQTTAKAAGVDISAYSMRHRVSAQTKQANPGDAVAVAMVLGHQSTATQGHYGRASRGGGAVSPISITGTAPGATVRGPKTRTGPPKHVQEARILSGVLSTAHAPPAPSRRL